LNLDLHENVALVTGDRIQLQQVVMNLLMNAIEAVSLCTSGPRQITVSSMQQSTTVVVSVRDSGPGFSRDDERRLFQAFFTTKPQGLGMGLPISRSIIESHGGCITAEHNEARGVTFRIALPTAKESPDATADHLRHR
jgi:two-component system, LuxR family, sensor kinase FixL